ncbi:MAG: heme-binding protein [Pseudomonadota bacterium]
MKIAKMAAAPIAALAMAVGPVLGAATPAAPPVLLLRDAVAMAQGATAAAERGGQAFSIVIVNREGRVILSQRMDGASFKSLELAEGKATTAAVIGAPSRLLEDALAKGDHSVLSVPGVIAIAGGLPVTVDGATIAAIGVSGGAPKDDEAIATAGLARYPGTKPR